MSAGRRGEMELSVSAGRRGEMELSVSAGRCLSSGDGGKGPRVVETADPFLNCWLRPPPSLKSWLIVLEWLKSVTYNYNYTDVSPFL